MSKKSIQIRKIILSAVFLALGWVLPFLTGQIPELGSMILPMHVPALLAGFILGPFYGLGIGLILPITRSLIFGMPPIFPTALCMCFELGAYGFISGLLFNLLRKKTSLASTGAIYIALFSALIIGRGVWGLARYFCGIYAQNTFTLTLFMSGAFFTAWPGIILQIILIPLLVRVLESLNVFEKLTYLKK